MPSYRTKIGHAHLKVRHLERSVAFYTRYFDLHVVEQVGDLYAFLTGGEMHHEIALQARGSMAPGPLPHGIGLYHIAFEVPSRADFAKAYRELTEGGVEVAAVNHFISWAMYFNDPDGNGLEIYCDTRHDPDGTPVWDGMNAPLPRAQILAALG